MPALSFLDARAAVLREVAAHRGLPPVEQVSIEAAAGRVLAEDIAADRPYPPFHRSMRDGFALRAADLPGRCRVIGEVRAGASFAATVGPGEAVEIMTGAPVPEGADCVVMVEHTARDAEGFVLTDRPSAAGVNIAPAGSEARAGDPVLRRGMRLDYTGIAWLATVGCSHVPVYARPRVAILATGDEIVPLNVTPATHQIRNSNSYALAAQVARAGGIPVILPVARDDRDETARLIRTGLECDLLLLSGGVSAGKYDFVELAMADLGATFFFDRVLIQPGAPAVFGRVQEKFFFGLPGNPASTMVTFEIFARAAIELLAGNSESPLPLTLARLTRPFRHKPGLTRFLPAIVRCDDIQCAEVSPVDWQGSGDVPAICRANAFLVADAHKPDYPAGDLIPVLMK